MNEHRVRVILSGFLREEVHHAPAGGSHVPPGNVCPAKQEPVLPIQRSCAYSPVGGGVVVFDDRSDAVSWCIVYPVRL